MKCQSITKCDRDDKFIITIKGANAPRRYCAIHALAFVKANKSIKTKYTIKPVGVKSK